MNIIDTYFIGERMVQVRKGYTSHKDTVVEGYFEGS